MNVRFDPVKRLRGRLTPPPDKSISHRAALLGAMAVEPVRIHNYLHAEDTHSTLDAMRAVGALVEVQGQDVTVRGPGLREAAPVEAPIDVGNAGTLMRLLPGWLAGQEGRSYTLDGDASIRRRPVDRIAEPLRAMGAGIEATDGSLPPFRVHGAHLQGMEYVLQGFQCGSVYKPIYVEAQAAVAMATLLRAGQTPPASLLNGSTTDPTNAAVTEPAVLLTPVWVNAANMQATVIKDKFVSVTDLCAAVGAAVCTAAGVQ